MSVPPSVDKALFWFRRDLRLSDNAGLYHALQSATAVYCVFVFDRDILDALPVKTDRRVEFIHGCVLELQQLLRAAGSDLIVHHGRAAEVIPMLAQALKVDALFTNEDYEPAARERDRIVELALDEAGIAFHAFKDQVLFARDEVLTQAGTPFTVFTPYKNACLKRLDDFYLRPYPTEKFSSRLARSSKHSAVPTLTTLGFASTNLTSLGIKLGVSGALETLDDFLERIDRYRDTRDFPSVRGVSYLSVHNRFGTVSIRRLARLAIDRRSAGADTWLSELIWRDFYFQILYHFPHAADSAFKPKYDKLSFKNNELLFSAWCEACTGYPIVDAAMRQLNQTGFMHNRLRMIVASFLTKDLLIDWRWGEKYFADNLNDFDQSANNGGWQWAASTGCDAQPYFRIFNPVSQSQRFDAQGKFIRRYVPELEKVPDKFIHAPWTLPPLEQKLAGCIIGKDYPAPIVDHDVARHEALAIYKSV
jgi:deoxyribodipyrimidine photo-lyase